MVTKGKKNGEYRFVFKPPRKAVKVSLAGSFNQWKPQPMRKQKTGEYALTLPLTTGYYEYKFLVDDQWIEDVQNGAYTLNPYGTANSVLKIE